MKLGKKRQTLYEKACQGKRQYKTRELAMLQRARALRAKKWKWNPDTINAYKCEFCPYWHLGNSDRDKKERRNERKKKTDDLSGGGSDSGTLQS